MEPQERDGWAITVRAKFKGLDLQLATSDILPRWGSGGERISFLLRLRHLFLLRVKCENRSPPPLRAPPPSAKPLPFLKEIFRRRRLFSRKNAASKSGSKRSRTGSLLGFLNHHKFQGVVALMIGSLFLLYSYAYEKYQKGIAIHAFASIFNLMVLLRTGRINLLLLRVAGMFATFGFCFNYLTYSGYLPMIALRLWRYIFNLGHLVLFYQILSPCISLFIMRR